MLISHSKKFIFIHTYKVAGSSIRNALSPYCSISLRQTPKIDFLKMMIGISPIIFSKNFAGHITAAELKKQLPQKIFDTYYKFAFTRNPWDWQVSLYLYGLKDKGHYQHQLFKSFKDFDEYLDWRVHNELKLQKSFVTDEENNILVDYIGKFESLNQDFEHISKTLNIPFQKLPHLNKTKEQGYASYFTPKTIRMVEEAFKQDIELFNYTFQDDRTN